MTLDQSREIISSLRPEDRAWAAGFFDGEGCFWRKKPGILGVSITQVHPEVLQKFADIMGIGSVNGPYQGNRSRDLGWKPQYYYRVSGSRAHHVARVIWPYLGSEKRRQYRLKGE